jgi:acyl-CoA synthetase (AMP-forming)/AMP-acid ligase II
LHPRQGGKQDCFVHERGATAAEVAAYLKECLPRFMCPNAVLPLDAMPLTPNGKIDRAALRGVYADRGTL